MSIGSLVKKPLYWKFHKEYRKEILERQMTFAEYMEKVSREDSRPTLKDEKTYDKFELKAVEEDILFLTSSKGAIMSSAREEFAKAFMDNPGTMIAYCDIFEGDMPIFRPEWSPDTFMDHFYFRGLVAIRQSLCNLNCGEDLVPDRDEELSENMLWSLCYRILKTTDAFGKRKRGSKPIIHVDKVLFKSEPLSEYISGEHLHVTEEFIQDKRPEVSVVIPSKDNPFLVKKCIQSLKATTPEIKPENLEIILVDNGSSKENKGVLDALSKELGFKYVYEPQPFNFSKMCNLGAENATKDFLLFLNDDIECLGSGWLGSMMDLASRQRVGAVGIKLLYPDKIRIQHVGITNLPIGPVHKLQFAIDESRAYDAYNRGVRDVLAVTGACLLMRRALFVEYSGFKEQFAVAFNDVDLCYRLHDAGYYNVVSMNYQLIHHESLSRGNDESSEKWLRLMQERKLLYSLHPMLENVDPYYSRHLNRNGLDTCVRPAYESGVEVYDSARSKDLVPIETDALEKARQDNCLHVRLEVCRDYPTPEIHGYGVVLGSDNSSFNTTILLRNVKDPSIVFSLEHTRQYRLDLVENMPDQINVGMCGFAVEFGKNSLPMGDYEIGMYAADRASKLRLYNFTERVLHIGASPVKTATRRNRKTI